MALRPAVWLATLSTVVGLATGMFTLRDQVFPSERGTAGAIDEGAYRARVGRICDELNAVERARRRDDRRLARELKSARTTTAQRDALLDFARRSASRSSHALAGFAGLRAARGTGSTHKATVASWQRNHARVLDYIERLDRAPGRNGLLAAVDHLSRERTALAQDGQRINEGLQRLGTDSCDIDPPVVTETVTLPAVSTPRPKRVETPRGTSTPAPSTAASPASPAKPPPPSANRVSPRVNIPSPPTTQSAPNPEASPRINTPQPAGPGSAGGEEG
jgi:hypothetical protein